MLFGFFSNFTYGANDSPLNTIVVTGTREAKSKAEVSESIESIDYKKIKQISPAHPADVMNRIPGVHINSLGGEGHMSSIRQPITTGGVYLFLEDGIPTRPTGSFNHNGLYEINLPQAERIEVTKGPGSSLYGSDSIGGIINTITKPSPKEKEIEINPEAGSYGWQRMLISGGAPINKNNGFRIDLNLTENEGYPEESGYSKYATTVRLDGLLNASTTYKSILSYSEVNQEDVSSLEEDDFRNDTRKNFYHGDIATRFLEALRVSTEFSYQPDSLRLITFTPFFRNNFLELMPPWMLTYDPNINTAEFQSFGLLTKYRRRLPKIGGEFITGIDLDHSPSTYEEQQIDLTQDGDIYTNFEETGRTNYDFNTHQTSISPYVHFEWQPLIKLRLNAGVRYDYFRVSYNDNLDTSIPESDPGEFTHLRPDSQDISYDHVSPKLGLIYRLHPQQNIYANYRHSFRVPSINQLFRSGSSTNTDDLNPIKADSFEIGLRGQSFSRFNYDVAIYEMRIEDDIVNYIDTISEDRKVINSGKTKHRGIEIGLNTDITPELNFATAWSFTDQKYKDFTAVFGFPPTEINYSGNTIAVAPTPTGQVALSYQPHYLAKTIFELQWEYLGSYFTDETNTAEYPGHDLFNLRASYDVTKDFQIYGRVMNITNELYSTLTRNQVGDPDIDYRPGLPRTFYAGFRAKF